MIYFVTGTDTDSGKTLISAALLHRANTAKVNGKPSTEVKTLGLKPIASGCELTQGGLRNADALTLMAHSTMKLSYDLVNPLAFLPAIAPHIAAQQVGLKLTADRVLQHLLATPLNEADFVLIEGAGGWRLPLGEGEYLSDTIKALQQTLLNATQPRSLGVILVVGMKLGCLNHALLTQEAIMADGLPILGWVANQVDPNMGEIEHNLASLKQMMIAPFMGYVPFLDRVSPEQAATYL